MEDQIIHLIISLFAVIVAIFAFAFIYKKFGHGYSHNDGSLQVISSLSIGTKEKLLLIQVGDEQLLVGVTQQKISTLHHLAHPIKAEIKDSTAKKSIRNIFSGRKK